MRAVDHANITFAGDGDIPSITPEALVGGRPLLVLAPHPDDESLGCGGLLAAAFSAQGAHVACLTDGAASHPGSHVVPPANLGALRRSELLEAVSHLGGSPFDVTWIGAPDGKLTASDAVVHALVQLAQATASGLVLAPSPLDPHCDHVAGACIGQQVAQALPGLLLGYYPVWSRWHGGGRAPTPTGTLAFRVPVGRHQAQKSAAIAAHRSQQGQIIPDDPQGFEMPPGFAEFFLTRDEVFFLTDFRVPQ